MTTTHRPDDALDATGRTRSRGGAAVALAAGAVLVATALAVHLRGGVEDLEFVHRVEAHPGTWLFGHVCMAVGGLLLVLGLPAVPDLAAVRGRRTVLVGTSLAVLGAASSALGDFAHGVLAYVLLDEVPAEVSLAIHEKLYDEPLIMAMTMPGMLLPLGVVVLGVGLLLARTVPVPAAVLLLVSPVLIQLGYMVLSLPMPLMVLPWVIGLGWVALVLVRPRDAR